MNTSVRNQTVLPARSRIGTAWLLLDSDEETQGLRIDVDTLDHVVTLSGDVDTAAESDLAEQIAGNIDEVERVQNELRVVGAAGQTPQ